MFKKVLIANRGEIAVRIIRACADLGIQTVAVYSEADSQALHVLLADEAICIGKAPATESYLKISNLLAAAEITDADAIHPGYGFLSENASFASICESCGLTFIGPSHTTIEKLGDKIVAKEIARRVKAPVIPGTEGGVETVEEGLKAADKIGYPLLVKAAAGGGGKGIRVVEKKEDFARHFASAKKEALAAFSNDEVYLEKMILGPRHIEIQVVGDKHGHYVHLGERDCTIQRRKQKLIEETPSPVISPTLRKKMGQAAIDIVKAANYHTVATVEFLLDEKHNFYFMEVNTRIQVEHTITEEATGIDLVSLQMQMAAGEKLKLGQEDIKFNQHVIQFRINAENPKYNFAPSPGLLEYYIASAGPDVRVDSACYSGYKIPPYYDSMIAKLIVRGKDRKQVIARSKRALKEFLIGGIHSTIPFHQYMLENEQFLSGKYQIQFIDTLIDEGCDFVLEE